MLDHTQNPLYVAVKRATRDITSLVRQAEPKPEPYVEYEFSNGRKFYQPRHENPLENVLE